MEKSTHSRLYEPIVERLKALREASGLTVRELADRLGRDPNLVWRIENFERRIDLLEFYFICRACGVDPKKEASNLMMEVDHLRPSVRYAAPRRSRPKSRLKRRR